MHVVWGTSGQLKTCTCLHGFDIIGIPEIWWDGSCGWSTGMEGFRLFRKDRHGGPGEGVALYVNDQLESMELCLGKDEEPAMPPKSGNANAGTGRMKTLSPL